MAIVLSDHLLPNVHIDQKTYDQMLTILFRLTSSKKNEHFFDKFLFFSFVLREIRESIENTAKVTTSLMNNIELFGPIRLNNELKHFFLLNESPKEIFHFDPIENDEKNIDELER